MLVMLTISVVNESYPASGLYWWLEVSIVVLNFIHF